MTSGAPGRRAAVRLGLRLHAARVLADTALPLVAAVAVAVAAVSEWPPAVVLPLGLVTTAAAAAVGSAVCRSAGHAFTLSTVWYGAAVVLAVAGQLAVAAEAGRRAGHGDAAAIVALLAVVLLWPAYAAAGVHFADRLARLATAAGLGDVADAAADVSVWLGFLLATSFFGPMLFVPTAVISVCVCFGVGGEGAAVAAAWVTGAIGVTAGGGWLWVYVRTCRRLFRAVAAVREAFSPADDDPPEEV